MTTWLNSEAPRAPGEATRGWRPEGGGWVRFTEERAEASARSSVQVDGA